MSTGLELAPYDCCKRIIMGVLGGIVGWGFKKGLHLEFPEWHTQWVFYGYFSDFIQKNIYFNVVPGKT